MLWLTELEQKGSDVTIEGQSTTLIALSDFVGNLGNTPLLQKPIEIVNSQVETASAQHGPDGSRRRTDQVHREGAARAVPATARGAGAGGRGTAHRRRAQAAGRRQGLRRPSTQTWQ